MIRFIEKIVEDLRFGKNIENYIIIVMVFIIIVLDTFNLGNDSWIANVTLAILALIALGRITDANRLDKIDKKISQVNQAKFLQEFPEELVDDMRYTTDLWIVGITLSRTINTHYSLFKRKLDEGASIKILLVEPASAATQIAAFRDRRGRQQSSYDKAVRSTLNDFCRLKASTQGKLEIKTINSSFSFGYYAINPNTPQGKIYLEHYSFKSEEGDVPKMILKRTDGFVYSSFLEQLNNLWDFATEWDCTKETDTATLHDL